MATKKSATKARSKKTSSKKKKTAKKKSSGASKASGKSKTQLRIEELSSGAQNLMLANLGLYGKVLDELQNQLKRAKSTIDEARKGAGAKNQELISRGEKLLQQIKDLLKKSGAPATRQLDKQIADLRSALDRMRKKIPK
ncbi:MAG: hypothetical protein OER22_03555 [Gammaproteobacteria bacterium]|nr:hypothetical protein [Gammaproteobacteria bacterium]MDH3371939.1 hypothetical protein [Gammaproteobacteria bacterium]MDH3407732.1 hypothetical protein [Gammaproteobacteria bacterium]MDH3551671.1 hypothetical protein [Gammaproteobacteria bacterium]